MAISGSGQDIHFTQFYANPLQLNPALTGSRMQPRILLNYRNQWPLAGKAFVTYAAGYDQPVSGSGAAGLKLFADRAGDGVYTVLGASAIYAHQVSLADNLTLSFGLEGGVIQHMLNESLLELPAAEVMEIQKRTEPDFSTGIYLASNKLYGGIAVHHLTRPDISLIASDTLRLSRRLTFHAGGIHDFVNPTREIFVSPNLLIMHQGNSMQINGGIYVNLQPFIFGGWYRHNVSNSDAVLFLLGLNSDRFRLGYSFDYPVSPVGVSSGGGHEFSLAYFLGSENSKKSYTRKAIKHPPL